MKLLSISFVLLSSGAGSAAASLPQSDVAPSLAARHVLVETVLAGGPTNDGLSVGPSGAVFASNNGSGGLPNGDTIYEVSPSGVVSVFATGLPNWPVGSDFGPDGSLFVSLWTANRVARIDPSGAVSTLANGVWGPAGLEVDDLGNVFVASWSTNRILKIDPAGAKSTHALGAPIAGPSGLALDRSSGVMYVANWADGRISRVDPLGGVSLFAVVPTAVGTGCAGLALDDRNVYATAYGTHRVFRIDRDSGLVSVLAGTGVAGTVDGPGTEARFDGPTGIALSPDGERLYVSQDPNSAMQAQGGDGSLRLIWLEQQHRVRSRSSERAFR